MKYYQIQDIVLSFISFFFFLINIQGLLVFLQDLIDLFSTCQGVAIACFFFIDSRLHVSLETLKQEQLACT